MSKPGGLSVISWCGAYSTADADRPADGADIPARLASALVKEDGRVRSAARRVVCAPPLAPNAMTVQPPWGLPGAGPAVERSVP